MSQTPTLSNQPVLNPVDSSLRRSLNLVTLAWGFGAVWITATAGAPITLFARAFDATPFQFGLLAAAPFVASLLSLPASVMIERTGWRKAIFLAGLYVQRGMWVPITLVPVAVWGWHPPAAAWALLALILIMHAGQAVGSPAWMSWMGDLVPARLRGRYFARRRTLGVLTAVPAAIFVGWMLDGVTGNPDHPDVARADLLTTITLIFLSAAVFGLADIALFQFVPHRVPPTPIPAPTLRQTLGSTLGAPLRDKRFLKFGLLVGLLVFALAPMGPFVTLYALERLGVGNTAVQVMLLAVPMAAQAVFFATWGRLIDRAGRVRVLKLGSIGLIPVGLGWCLLSPLPNELAVVLGCVLAAAGAVLWAGVEMANFDLVLTLSGKNVAEGTSRRERASSGGSGYTAVNGLIVNVAGATGGLAFGVLAYALKDWQWTLTPGPDPWRVGYFEALFALSAIVRAGAILALLPLLGEDDEGLRPRRRAREAQRPLRLTPSNLYSNLSGGLTSGVVGAGAGLLRPLRRGLRGRLRRRLRRGLRRPPPRPPLEPSASDR